MKHVLVILLASATVAWGQVQYAFTNFAGVPGGPGSADGVGLTARFSDPEGVAVDSAGNIYVADADNSTIRKITPDGVVTTLAGLAGSYGSADGTGSSARFSNPSGLAVESGGTVYVADASNNTIRKITAAGAVTTFAGSPEQSGSDDGIGSAAGFNTLGGLAIDSAGNLYAADLRNHTIRKITPDRVVTTLAGSPGQRGSADGTGSDAQFNAPLGVTVDGAGNVYVADQLNSTLRKITPAGVVTTLAGLAQDTNGDGYNDGGYADGTGSTARFNQPRGVAVDSAGNLYVTDRGNATIRKITPDGVVTTIAGSAGDFGDADGAGTAARFGGLFGIAVDTAGNLYVTDRDRITKGTPLPSAPFQFVTAGNLTVSNGLLRLRLTGPSGRMVVVEASANLQAWTPVQTNALPSGTLDFSFALGADQDQFFRARLAP